MKQPIAAILAGLSLVALAAGAETGISIPENLKASQNGVRTAGGTSPAEACGQAQAGKVARVAYEAVYYFYVPRP